MAISNELEKRFLERLKGQQTLYAKGVLEQPADKTEFGFGQASGIYHGLRLAEQLFEEVIGEDDDTN